MIAQDDCALDDCDKPRRKAGGGRSRFCSMHHAIRHRSGIAKVAPLRAPDNTGCIDQDGYLIRSVGVDHPLANANGVVAMHRIVLWNALEGQDATCHWCGDDVFWIPGFAQTRLVADHLNGDRSDNSVENLVPSCTVCNMQRGRLGNPLDYSRTPKLAVA